jgi:hypothetical protein
MDNLRNDHNVYILGAGFSAEAEMPLIRDFLLRMRDGYDWLVSQGRKEEARSVAKVLEYRLRATSAAYWVNLDLENIETLFSLASADSGEIDKDVRIAIAATLDFARKTNPSLPTNVHVAGPSQLFNPIQNIHPQWARKIPSTYTQGEDRGMYQFSKYAYHCAALLGMFGEGRVKGHNTFITFNYDTLVEEALTELKVPFGYGFKADTVEFHSGCGGRFETVGVPVLKLHGSVNWARQNSSNKLDCFASYEALMQEKRLPELIPPTWKKVFERQLQEIWNTAVQEMATATRIVVIGFSIPSTDLHFKYLLAAGLQNNVSLREILFVDPCDEEIIQQKAKLLFRSAYVEGKRIRKVDSYLSGMTMSNHSLNQIARPFEEGVGVTPSHNVRS